MIVYCGDWTEILYMYILMKVVGFSLSNVPVHGRGMESHSNEKEKSTQPLAEAQLRAMPLLYDPRPYISTLDEWGGGSQFIMPNSEMTDRTHYIFIIHGPCYLKENQQAA